MHNLTRTGLVLLATLACSASLSALSLEELKGNWKIDAETTWKNIQESPQFADMPDEQQSQMKETFLKSTGTILLHFAADGMTVTDGPDEVEKAPASGFASTNAKTGTWKTESQNFTLELQADGKLSMIGEDKMTIILKPVPAPALESAPAPLPVPGK